MNDIEKVIAIALEAGEILKKYYKTEYQIATKTHAHDFVTTADREADAFIRKQLGERFPDDAVLSEESPERPDIFSSRVWIVDPLDGTAGFIRKEADWCVSIGLCADGRPVLGVLYFPLLGEILYAEKGKGAWQKKKKRNKSEQQKIPF